jgi:N6-L-threonylcarbamoyladenine synthase
VAGLILAIETSCDDTCAAVLEGARIRSNLISSQDAAARRLRRRRARGRLAPPPGADEPVVEAALAEAGARSTRSRRSRSPPGRADRGAAGRVSTAKAIAAARRLPLIPVDHLQGHVAANFLEPEPLEPPFLCLIASGGHTLLAAVRDHAGTSVWARRSTTPPARPSTRSARLLGLGFPGGPALQKLAEAGDPEAFEMPVAMARDPASTSASAASRRRSSIAAANSARGRGGAPRRPRRVLPGGGRGS